MYQILIVTVVDDRSEIQIHALRVHATLVCHTHFLMDAARMGAFHSQADRLSGC